MPLCAVHLAAVAPVCRSSLTRLYMYMYVTIYVYVCSGRTCVQVELDEAIDQDPLKRRPIAIGASNRARGDCVAIPVHVHAYAAHSDWGLQSCTG